MKIAVITTIDDIWGGSEELWYQTALAALAEGHSVHVSMKFTGALAPKIQELIGKGLVLHKRRGYIKKGTPAGKRILKKAWHLLLNSFSNPYKSIYRARPDIVIFNSSLFQAGEDNYFHRLQQAYHRPYVVITQVVAEFNRPFSNTPSQAMRDGFLKAAKVFFVSRRNFETIQRHLALALPNGEVITNPVNLADTVMIPYPAMDGVIKLGVLGNLQINHKGQDIIIAVLSREEWKNRNWHLNIYGRGPDEEYLKALCVQRGIAGKVSFCGHVSDIREVWKENHALLMCSIMEGLPLAVVEAMLCGRPVITTDVGGNREIIDDGINGFIAEGPTEFSLNRALQRAWNRKDEWAHMGSLSHETAKKFYVPDIGQRLLEKIKSLHQAIPLLFLADKLIK